MRAGNGGPRKWSEGAAVRKPTLLVTRIQARRRNIFREFPRRDTPKQRFAQGTSWSASAT
jgi:hypothetical protein